MEEPEAKPSRQAAGSALGRYAAAFQAKRRAAGKRLRSYENVKISFERGKLVVSSTERKEGRRSRLLRPDAPGVSGGREPQPRQAGRGALGGLSTPGTDAEREAEQRTRPAHASSKAPPTRGSDEVPPEVSAAVAAAVAARRGERPPAEQRTRPARASSGIRRSSPP